MKLGDYILSVESFEKNHNNKNVENKKKQFLYNDFSKSGNYFNNVSIVTIIIIMIIIKRLLLAQDHIIIEDVDGKECNILIDKLKIKLERELESLNNNETLDDYV